MRNLIGKQLGKYQIRAEIGRGGMGMVYLGYDPLLDRQVAIKVLAPHLMWEQESVERFLREARAAARLKHPNIVTIYDVGQEDNWYYFVMEYLPGEPLAARLHPQQAMPIDEALPILGSLAAGLDYAHQRGIIHRDVKPSNVVITTEGHIVLTDFGIARAAQEGRLTMTGTVVGTPEYMAPEQADGRGVDARSDQYSLAVIAYQMLTGQVPFQAESTLGLIYKLVSAPPPPLSQYRPDLPPAAGAVLARALAKDPNARYPTVLAFVEALGRALQGVPRRTTLPIRLTAPPATASAKASVAKRQRITPPPPGQLPEPAVARRRPSPVVMGGIALLLLGVIGLLAAGGAWLYYRSRPQTDATRPAATIASQATAGTSSLTIAPGGKALPTATLRPTPTAAATATPTATTHRTATVAARATQTTRARATATARSKKTATAQAKATTTAQAKKSPTATPTRAASTLAQATPASREPSLAGKLAFSVPQGPHFKVYVVEVGPAPPTSLYASIGNARQPALSHDGKWLLVNGTGGGIDAIARMTSDGHQAQPVTCIGTTAESGRPTWSPDDRFLAFDGLAANPNRPQVYIQRIDEMDCDLGDNRLQVNGGDATDANGLWPLWGPDNRIYIRSCATWNPQTASSCGLWSVRVDGGGLRHLTENPSHLPTDVNSERLLFMFNSEGNWDVYSIGLEGGTPQNLTQNPATDVWGTLSPDGRSIAFLSNRSGRWAIWLANVDGSNPREWLPISVDWGVVDPSIIGEERMSWSK